LVGQGQVPESCALQPPQNPPHDPKNEDAERDGKQYSEHRADHFALPAAVIAASAGAAKILGRISHLRMEAVTTMTRSPQGKRHLPPIMKYATYYNEMWTHVSLGKDAPCTRLIERIGDVIAHPILGGLHHRYARL
jgi:hypothetical protein